MTRAFILLACCGFLTPIGARAQAPAPDPIRELLTEVRALRLAMERAATVGARIQLLVARVQLQEQRIAELSRRATAVREEIARLDPEVAQSGSAVGRMEAAAARAASDERADIEAQLENFRAHIEQSERRRQDLGNEEALLLQQLAADQGRWSDVNGQLDELERTLVRPKP